MEWNDLAGKTAYAWHRGLTYPNQLSFISTNASGTGDLEWDAFYKIEEGDYEVPLSILGSSSVLIFVSPS